MKSLRVLGSLLLIFVLLTSYSGCFGYATRLPKNTYDKVNTVVLGVNGDQYVLESKYHNSDMYDFVPVIKDALDSGKIDISNAFGQVKMPCDDSAVEYNKESWELWFEILIENGKYKKLFFTLNENDTQTIWIYATATDSYNDGGFLEYLACDCKELVELATKYATIINGIDASTKIEITKYDFGEEADTVTITDEASIAPIVGNLTSLRLKRLEYNEPTAIEYDLVFYNEKGEMIQSISVTINGWVEYHGSLHSVIIGEIDEAYIRGIFDQIPI